MEFTIYVDVGLFSEASSLTYGNRKLFPVLSLVVFGPFPVFEVLFILPFPRKWSADPAKAGLA